VQAAGRCGRAYISWTALHSKEQDVRQCVGIDHGLRPTRRVDVPDAALRAARDARQKQLTFQACSLRQRTAGPSGTERRWTAKIASEFSEATQYGTRRTAERRGRRGVLRGSQHEGGARRTTMH